MSSVSDTIKNTGADASEQIRQLRAEMDTLMRDRVRPSLADAAGRAQDAARQATDIAQDKAEALSEQVRERPFVALLIAGAVGYLVGRVMR